MKSATKYLFLLLFLVISQFGNAQNVFNKAFDVNSAANASANILEEFNQYYFTQVADYNGFSHIQTFKIDSIGNFIDSNSIIQSKKNLFFGYAGSFQFLTSNEFCQLYHIGPDSGINLVFFDSNLNIIRDKRYNFNFFVNAGVVKQINDSTLITLGRVKNTSNYNLFLINTDLQGNERWRSVFGETGQDDYGFAIEYMHNKILVSGNSKDLGPHLFEFNMNGSLTFDTIYSNYYWGRNLIYHPNFGLYFLVAQDNVGNSQGYSVLLKLNSNYQIEWQKEYFTEEVYTYFQQLTINDQGIITFGGGSMVNNQFMGLFFQTNHSGDSLGSKLLDYIPGERAQFHDIRPTSDGGYILAGDAYTPNQDSWIVKVNEWGCDSLPCTVSVDEQPKNAIGTLSCYPNPSNGLGTVKGSFKNTGSNNGIKVFNSLGQLVFSKSITNKEFEMEVNLPNRGLYLVNLYQGNELVRSLKWVVELD